MKVFCVCLVLVLLFSPQFSLSQDTPENVPLTDDQKKRIAEAKAKEEEQKAIKAQADAEKAAADAEKAAVDAKSEAEKAKHPIIAAPDVSKSESETSIGDKKSFFETEILSARSGHRVSENIAASVIAKLHGQPVVLFTASDFQDLFKLKATKSQLSVLTQNLDRAVAGAEALIGPVPAPTPKGHGFVPFLVPFGVDAVNSALQSAVNLLSLLKTDTTIGSSEVAPDTDILDHAVAGLLSAAGVNVFYPSKLIPGLFTVNSSPLVLDSIHGVVGSRQKAAEMLSLLADKLADEKESLSEKKIDQPTFDEFATKEKIAEDTIKAAIAAADTETNALTSSSDSTSSLTTLLRAEAIYEAICGTDTKCANPALPESPTLLWINTERAGGSYKTKKNILTLFTGPALFHSGGVVVTWALYDSSGRFLAGDTETGYSGYVRNGDIGSAIDVDFGTVVVTAVPSAAGAPPASSEVTIDGKFIGMIPVIAVLKKGPHKVQVGTESPERIVVYAGRIIPIRKQYNAAAQSPK